jgi:hypothetical protein
MNTKAKKAFMRKFQKWILVFGAALVCEMVCRGQANPSAPAYPDHGQWLTIKGTVLDPSGAAAPGVFLLLINGKDYLDLMRLETNGQIDPSFHCETANCKSERVMDTAILVSTVNGAEVPHIAQLARLNPDGSVYPLPALMTSVKSPEENPAASLDQASRSSFLAPESLFGDFGKGQSLPVVKLGDTPLSATSTLAVNLPGELPETILITSINMDAGGALIQFDGTALHPYILQGKNSLNDVDWVVINTNQADASGIGAFRDNDAKNHPMRFYRIASP